MLSETESSCSLTFWTLVDVDTNSAIARITINTLAIVGTDAVDTSPVSDGTVVRSLRALVNI